MWSFFTTDSNSRSEVKMGISTTEGYDYEIPKYESEGAAGLDLRANIQNPFLLPRRSVAMLPTGIKVSITEGYVGLLAARSGVCNKLELANSVGIIDSDYRGEIKVPAKRGVEGLSIQPGERIAQLIVMPFIQTKLIEVDNLIETNRGEQGFGSTGKF